jgi:hypothetical protein
LRRNRGGSQPARPAGHLRSTEIQPPPRLSPGSGSSRPTLLLFDLDTRIFADPSNPLTAEQVLRLRGPGRPDVRRARPKSPVRVQRLAEHIGVVSVCGQRVVVRRTTTSPRSPRSGRTGGRIWLVLIPLVLAFAAVSFIPTFGAPDSRDVGSFLGSDDGRSFLSGNWGWFALQVVLWVFNTVLGEELLFRGFLLPRMNGAFGRGDWVANGVLFAAYHLHLPWLIAANLLDTFILSYPTKRYQSAWIGITVHRRPERIRGSHRPPTCSLSNNIPGQKATEHGRRSTRTIHARTNSRCPIAQDTQLSDQDQLTCLIGGSGLSGNQLLSR